MVYKYHKKIIIQASLNEDFGSQNLWVEPMTRKVFRYLFKAIFKSTIYHLVGSTFGDLVEVT